MGYFSFDVGVLNKLAYHSQTLTRLKQYILIYIYISSTKCKYCPFMNNTYFIDVNIYS